MVEWEKKEREMEKLKKALRILMVVIFPLGVIYCVGKSLFSGGFAQFLGGIFLAIVGALLAIYFLRYDLIEPIVNFFVGIVGK